MMSRLSAALEGERKSLLAYIVAGDPDREATLELMHDLAVSYTHLTLPTKRIV